MARATLIKRKDLAAQLDKPSEYMFHTGERQSDAGNASLLRLRQCSILGSVALDVHAPTLAIEARFAFAVDKALVRIDVTTRVAWIDHRLKVQRVVFAGSADIDLSNEPVRLVGTGRELVAEIELAMPLGPACLDIFLVSLRCAQSAGMA